MTAPLVRNMRLPLGILRCGGVIAPQRAQKLAWEDLYVGCVIPLPDMTFSRNEIVTFAGIYDPQPAHIDDEAAKSTLLGGLAASGWHSCAALWARAHADLLAHCRHRGRPVITDIRWLAPVRANETLQLKAVVTHRMPCPHSAHLGQTSIRYEVINEMGSVVMNLKADHAFERRVGEPSSNSGPCPSVNWGARITPLRPRRRVSGISFFEQVEVGDEIDLETYTFTDRNIAEFAALTGSMASRTGDHSIQVNAWHLNAAWMQRIVAYYQSQTQRLGRAGTPVPLLGPAIGVKHLRWHRRAQSGDVVHFLSWAERKIDLPSHGGWGLLVCGAEGADARGRRVVSFNPQLLLERRCQGSGD
jgi:acyl dehydratase